MIEQLLRIKGIGQASAEKIAAEFETWEEFVEAILSDDVNDKLKAILGKFYDSVKEQVNVAVSEVTEPFTFDAEEEEAVEENEEEKREERDLKTEFETMFSSQFSKKSDNKYILSSPGSLAEVKNFLKSNNVKFSVLASWEGLTIVIKGWH